MNSRLRIINYVLMYLIYLCDFEIEVTIILNDDDNKASKIWKKFQFKASQNWALPIQEIRREWAGTTNLDNTNIDSILCIH